MRNLLRRLSGQAPRVTVNLAGLPRFEIETHGRSDPYVSTAIERWGHWEGSGTSIVVQLLVDTADFLDIGANIGWYTLVAGHALAGRGHVHSFEPDPTNLARLRTNVALNRLDNVTVNGWALADRSGSAILHLNHTNRGDSSLFPHHARRLTTTVTLGRLDDYAGLPKDRPLVMKIDVQGGEIDVLAGARQLLAGYPHEIVLMCELSPACLAAGGHTAAELADLLGECRFAAAWIDRDPPRIVPMSWDRLLEMMQDRSRRDPRAEGDFLAYRRIDGLLAPIFHRAGSAAP